MRFSVLLSVFAATCFLSTSSCGDQKEEGLAVNKWQAIFHPRFRISEVAELYELWTGDKVTAAPEVLADEIYFSQKGPFSKREGAEFLRLTLKVSGFELSEEKNETLKVTRAPFQLTKAQLAAAKKKPAYDGKEFQEIELPEGESILLPRATGREIAELIGKIAGQRIILSPVTGTVDFSLVVRGPSTRGEVIGKIWDALADKGCGLVPAPGDVLLLVVADEKKLAGNREKRKGPRTRYIPKPQ